jgi:hypothetical protein
LRAFVRYCFLRAMVSTYHDTTYHQHDNSFRYRHRMPTWTEVYCSSGQRPMNR